MSERTNPKTHLTDEKVPVIPRGSYVAVKPIREEKLGNKIIAPGDQASMDDIAKMQRGQIIKMKVVAIAPDYMQSDRFESDPFWIPGMIIFAKVPFDCTSETVEYYDKEDGVNHDCWVIPDSNIYGLSRNDKQPHFETPKKEQADG